MSTWTGVGVRLGSMGDETPDLEMMLDLEATRPNLTDRYKVLALDGGYIVLPVRQSRLYPYRMDGADEAWCLAAASQKSKLL